MRLARILGLAALATFAAGPTQAATSAIGKGLAGVAGGVVLTAGKKAKATKSCGAFMYRKDGKCVDARGKK